MLDQLPGRKAPHVKAYNYDDEEEEPTPELDNEEAEIEAAFWGCTWAICLTLTLFHSDEHIHTCQAFCGRHGACRCWPEADEANLRVVMDGARSVGIKFASGA